MANQPEAPTYDAGVYQLETTDLVQGGVGGTSNIPLLNLANRTAYLKRRLDLLLGADFQLFTSSGTFTVPDDVTEVEATVIAGGSGGSGSGSTSTIYAGGNGAGGGWSIKRCAVSPGDAIAAAVGSGGGGSAAGVSSTPGGASSFGAFCSATGGGAATLIPIIGAGGHVIGGTGGSGSGGDLNGDGDDGSDGTDAGTHTFCRTNIAGWSGRSGGSLWGGGRRTGGDITNSGGNFGAGGAGTYFSIAAATAGGNGAHGCVLVRWSTFL